MNFNDKVVLVTGASSGIGAAIAIKFASAGAKVSIVGRNKDKLENVSKICKGSGPTPFLIVADVTNDSDAKRIVVDTVKHYGKLDILVNNAGVGGSVSLLDENFMNSFDRVMNTNVRSIAYITHLAAPHLIKSKGSVINISSVAALLLISPRSAAYCSSKAALDHFSRNIALELATHGVRVTCVNPGPVKTDIVENMNLPPEHQAKLWKAFEDSTALGKISDPEEVADLVLFLASSSARSITGASYVIDNGSTLKGSWIPQ